MISAKEFTSFVGSQPAFLAQSNQKEQPVSGEKCQRTISRTCVSNCSLACASRRASLTTSPDFIMVVIVLPIAALCGYRFRFGPRLCWSEVLLNCRLRRGGCG